MNNITLLEREIDRLLALKSLEKIEHLEAAVFALAERIRRHRKHLSAHPFPAKPKR